MCISHIRKDDGDNRLNYMDLLASKASELSTLGPIELRALCDEILSNFQLRADEWSTVDNWTIRETELLEIHPVNNNNNNEVTSSHATLQSSNIRYLTGSCMKTFITTYKSKLNYDLELQDASSSTKKTLMPKFLEKKRKIILNENEDNNKITAYGPTSMSIPGHSFELWTEEISQKNKQKNVPLDEGAVVTVVLGAGNQSFLSLIDTLQICLVDKEVVLLKHHPIRPHLFNLYSILLEPLIQKGYIRQIQDKGIPETTAMLSDKRVARVHLTGSLKTEQAVFPIFSQKHDNNDDNSQIREMVTSELGCVTPVIVVPGQYKEKELIHMARSIACSKKMSGGCNCNCANALVLPLVWEQKDVFRTILIEELQRAYDQPAYYPGAREKKSMLMKHYQSLGEDRATVVKGREFAGVVRNSEDNVVLLECGTPGKDGFDGTALIQEAFCPALAVVELDSNGCATEYLENVVVPFLNNKENIYGSLSCMMFAPQSFFLEKNTDDVLDKTIAHLNYGTVAVNTLSLLGYMAALEGGMWGGHYKELNHQSGYGCIGNLYGIEEQPSKSVVRGPPLLQSPVFDGGAKLPVLLIDGMHVITTSKSTIGAVLGVLQMLFVRGIVTILHPLARYVYSGGPKILTRIGLLGGSRLEGN